MVSKFLLPAKFIILLLASFMFSFHSSANPLSACIVFGSRAAGETNAAEELVGSAALQNAFFYRYQLLTAQAGAEGDFMGTATAISGDGSTIIVTSPYDDTNKGSDSGSAHVYVYNAETIQWDFQQILEAEDGYAFHTFGTSAALSSDGSIAFIGAPLDDRDTFEDAGSVYVFLRNESGVWTQHQKLTTAGGAEGFGSEIALSSDGSLALIGAPCNQNQNVGAAYTFKRDDISGLWAQQQVLTGQDSDVQDRFGVSVALNSDGTTALVGMPWDNSAQGEDTGAAYVFTFDGLTWTQQQKIFASDREHNENFGFAVSLSSDGNTAAVGAPFDSSDDVGSGSVYLYTRTAGLWSQLQKLRILSDGTLDNFGTSVSLTGDGNTLLVGVPGDDTAFGHDAGSAYLYTYDTTGGVWAEHSQLLAPDSQSDDTFGQSVSFSSDGTTAVIGAPFDNTTFGSDTGSAYVLYRGPVEILVNGGFETGLEPWSLKRKSKDKIKCNKTDKIFSHSGECAFKFKAVVPEGSKIIQNAPVSNLLAGNTLTASVWYWTKSNVTPRMKVVMRVFYDNAGTENKDAPVKSLITTAAPGIAPDSYIQHTLDPYTIRADLGLIVRVKVKFYNRATTGKIFLDDASVTLGGAVIPVTAGGLLPLPPAK